MFFPDDDYSDLSTDLNHESFSQNRTNIRSNVIERVNEILLLDKYVHEDKYRNELKERSKSISERCLVCTLLYGTCEHTREWIDKSIPSWTTKSKTMDFEENFDESIDDVLNVIEEFKIDTSPVVEDINIETMQWNILDQLLSDKIGHTEVCLFSPDERGWLSTISLNPKLIMSFGGFKYKLNQVPQPFTSVSLAHEVEYCNDIRAYDLDNTSWHGIKARGNKECSPDELKFPEGRYGHVAASLGSNRMIIFGGRGVNGRILNDTWVYSYEEDQWSHIQNNEALNLPAPSPRYFSACCSVRIASSKLKYNKKKSSQKPPELQANDVYLFGGTDGNENYGDLWIFRGDPSIMRWERLVAVGLPPCPRYGHQFVTLTEEEEAGCSYGIRGQGQQLMVLGGCFVSPQGEMIGSNLAPAEIKQLMVISNELRKRYKDESQLIHTAGLALESNTLQLGMQSSTISQNKSHISEVFHQAALLSATMHSLEESTRAAEKAMVDSFNTSQAQLKFNITKARHPNPKLDVYLLNVNEMIWRSQDYPPIKGNIPTSRIHFGASCIGRYVFVMGGAEPTSLKYKHVESDTTNVYALNLQKMRWETPTPLNSPEHLLEPLRIADADVIRAIKRCDEEKFRGLSLGALNGKTVELCEAQAILEVCKWRRTMLQKEQTEQSCAPIPRWGAALLAHGQRMFYIGGWNTSQAVKQGQTMVLNVEQPHERRRRLEDEYKAKLERFRIKEQAEANMANVQSVYELRAIKAAEQQNREREWKHMLFEDFRSSIPPLSCPERVEFTASNEHTIWVQWKRVTQNSNREPIDPESVVYFLYIRNSFENFGVNDRVFATLEPIKSGKKQVKHLEHEYDSPSVYFNKKCKRYPAEITNTRGDGYYDLLFDDGLIIKDIPRHRLKMAPKFNLANIPPAIPFAIDKTSPKKISSNTTTTTTNNNNINSNCNSDKTLINANTNNTKSMNLNYSYMNLAIQSSLTKYIKESEDYYTIISLDLCQAVKQRIQNKMITRNKKIKKLNEMSGLNKKLIKEKEIQDHLDRLDLMAGKNTKKLRQSLLMTSTIINDPNNTNSNNNSINGLSSFNIDINTLKSSFMMSPLQSITTTSTNNNLNNIFNEEEMIKRKEDSNEYEFIDYQNYFSNNAFIHNINAPPITTTYSSISHKNELQKNNDFPPRLTVQVDPHWTLVYVGNENTYACTHLVPPDILLHEEQIKVPVQFALQVLGADHPIYERSELSHPVTFFTKSPTEIITKALNTSLHKQQQLSNHATTTTTTTTNTTMSNANTMIKSGTTSPSKHAMSKVKREILTAVMNDKETIQIEKFLESGICESRGIGESYL